MAQSTTISVVQTDPQPPDSSQTSPPGFSLHSLDIYESHDEATSTDVDVEYPPEYFKTCQAFLFLVFGILCSCISLAVIHDFQPVLVPPLPDITFHFIPQVDRGQEMCEYILLLLIYPTLFCIALHQHRSIILRRAFFLTGLLYLFRAVTMAVTLLPQANTHFVCAVRSNHTNFSVIAYRTFSLFTKLGMSVNGSLPYCGDFIFSGHTCSLVLCCMFFAEYTPKKIIACKVAKWLMYLLAAIGVALLNLSRTHYTLDILIAYVATKWLFCMYHSAVVNFRFKHEGTPNYFSRFWWYLFVVHFERNVPAGKLPVSYLCPKRFYHTYLSNFIKAK